jgi:hypothetical protein
VYLETFDFEARALKIRKLLVGAKRDPYVVHKKFIHPADDIGRQGRWKRPTNVAAKIVSWMNKFFRDDVPSKLPQLFYLRHGPFIENNFFEKFDFFLLFNECFSEAVSVSNGELLF